MQFIKKKEKAMTTELCRPKVLTDRWVKEFSTAIAKLCQNDGPPAITQAEQWPTYFVKLQNARCIKEPLVRQIIRYERDYREFL
jgi:hypothetical protein